MTAPLRLTWTYPAPPRLTAVDPADGDTYTIRYVPALDWDSELWIAALRRGTL